MIENLVRWLYRASGRRYRYVVLVGEAGSSVLVAAVSVAVVSTFYDPPLGDVLLVGAVGVVATAVAVSCAVWRGGRKLVAIDRWKSATTATPRETAAAWAAATSFTLRQYRRLSGLVGLVSVVRP